MNSEWMSGAGPPSHRMRVVSDIWGSGVSVLPVTAPTVDPAPPPPPPPPGGGGTSLALIMFVRGPSTTMPVSDGSPIYTRLMGFFCWCTWFLPLLTQCASLFGSLAHSTLG